MFHCDLSVYKSLSGIWTPWRKAFVYTCLIFSTVPSTWYKLMLLNEGMGFKYTNICIKIYNTQLCIYILYTIPIILHIHIPYQVLRSSQLYSKWLIMNTIKCHIYRVLHSIIITCKLVITHTHAAQCLTGYLPQLNRKTEEHWTTEKLGD